MKAGAKLEAVIEACAEAAVRYYMTPGIDSDFAIAEVRRVVTEAGRRAVGLDLAQPVSQAAGPLIEEQARGAGPMDSKYTRLQFDLEEARAAIAKARGMP